MLGELLQNATAFLRANPVIATLIAVAMAALFYWKTKETLKMVAFVLFILVVFYFITLFAGTVRTGSNQKDQMIYKSREALGE